MKQLEIFKVPPAGICFVITETAAFTYLARAVTLIRERKLQGRRFSLDHFGSGMASFAFRKHLPVTARPFPRWLARRIRTGRDG